ncbi:hypothetical protein [Ancylobacter vacuolatus]|uniref:DUF4760 domain-containing protein n=1 Tax=Ancylobacter vacuolatus TaxID=223389 RepID=A0ABU0DI16_9HYPH|nr:hypothetical protein [Ancylobacter vacuolatus]MDQ0348074.1 hypothetical protein [Ancylobacter vacuolatus]
MGTEAATFILEKGVLGLLLLALTSATGYLATKAYEIYAEQHLRSRRVREFLIELRVELVDTRKRSAAYSSEEFIRGFEAIIDAEHAAGIPFRPFIALDYDEESYEEKKRLLVHIPSHLMPPVRRYIMTSRMVWLLLVKIQSEDFTNLTPARKKTVIHSLAALNRDMGRAIDELEPKLWRQARYDRRLWEDPHHLATLK